MTINDAINSVDALKHNTFETGSKVKWLSTVDAMVKRDIIDTHEGGESVSFDGYDENMPGETVLLVPAPYDEMYLRWMEAQIDYHNGEYGKFNNAIEMFNTMFQAYADHYHRNHKPKSGKNSFF